MAYDFYVRTLQDLIDAVQEFGIVPYFATLIPSAAGRTATCSYARHSQPARTPARESFLSSLFAEIAGIRASANTRKIPAKQSLQNVTVSLGRVLVLWGKADCHTRFAGSFRARASRRGPLKDETERKHGV